MKKTIFKISSVLFLGFLVSCSKSVGVNPNEQSSDFNFVATSAYDFIYPNADFDYIMPVELYVRPVENLNENTTLSLTFNSNQSSKFVINSDTLLSGDKVNLKYKDFKNYRVLGRYITYGKGNQNVEFQIAIGKTTKASKIALLAR
ncbi:hypothetical protein [Emticicia sp. SJ17W-69]|uniref:hypothetical protein n=1 Tax=Emticicia sp. SJ17W-69 TaxID=3421657 RepID=UPI003EBF3E0E